MANSADVAKAAGVSRATVSAVLNGKAAHARISDETVRRVQEAAQQLGYVVTHQARSLRTGVSASLGFAACGSDGHRAENLYLGAAQAAAQAGWHCSRAGVLADSRLVRVPDEQFSDVAGGIAELRCGRYDDLIIDAGADAFDETILRRLLAKADKHAPVVIDGPDDIHGPRLDLGAALQRALRHLAILGHRHTLCIDDGGLFGGLTRHQREKLAVLSGVGLLMSDHRQLEPRHMLAPLLPGATTRATALICSGTSIAVLCMSLLAMAGRQVPRDCSVITLDDGDAAWAVPALNSIQAPYRELGASAFACVQGEKPKTLQARYVERESCGKAAVS